MIPEHEFHALCRYTPIRLAQGIHRDISRATYDSLPYISSTVLKKWLKLGQIPSKFGYWLKTRWDEERGEALILGDALDTRMLEPNLFPFKFCTVPPDAPKRPSKTQIHAKKPSAETLAAIGFWNKFQTENKDKQVLTADQMLAVNGMDSALIKAPTCIGLFEHCRKATLIGEFNGWPAKVEIDLWNPSTTHIIDLKTAADCGEDAFGYACDKFGYFEQAVWYLKIANSLGKNKRQFSWCVVESSPPFAVQVYTFDPEGIEEHAAVYQATLEKMQAAHDELLGALTEGIWEDSADWRPVKIPQWRVANARREVLV